MPDHRDNLEWWEEKFNADVRLRPDQKFKTCMCCNVANKLSSRWYDLAENIVFKDKLNAKYWHDYVMYLIEKMDLSKYPKRKEQVMRLLHFGLEVMDGQVDGNDNYYVKLHLLKASMAGTPEDALRQYEHMWKRKIGLKNAAFYLFWADLEIKREHISEAKTILKNGQKKNATPSGKLDEKLASLEQRSDPFDDGEIEFAPAPAAAAARRKSLRSTGADPEGASRARPAGKQPALVLGDSDNSSDDGTIALDDLTTKVDPAARAKVAAAPPSALGGAVRVPSFPSKSFEQSASRLSARPKDAPARKASEPRVVVGDSGSDEDDASDDTAEDTRPRRRSLRAAVDPGGDEDGSTDELTRSSRLLGKPAAESNPCDESVVVFKRPSARAAKPRAAPTGRPPAPAEEQMGAEEDDSTAERTVQLRRRSTRAAVTETEEKAPSKASLKKYVDDKILNFDPQSYAASRQAKAAAQAVVASTKTRFVIPEGLPRKATAPEAKKTEVSMAAGDCDESMLDETVCADTVRLSPGRPVGEPAADDVVEFAPGRRVSSARKRSLRPASVCAAGEDSDENAGLGDLLSRGGSPVSVSSRRSSKQPRLSKSSIDDVDKENQPVRAAAASKAAVVAPGGGSDNVIAVVTSSTKRRMPAAEERGGGKRSRGGAEGLAHGSFGGALLGDPSRVIVLNGKQYLRLNVLGKGGSSCVYLVLAESGALYAYKRVDVHGSDETADSVLDSYENEIRLLNALKGSSHIIQLIDSCVSRDEMSIAMVLEAGDVDLARVLSRGHYGFTNTAKGSSGSGSSSISNPFFLRTVWGEMLEAVDYIHENRIVHGDLKPANFVFVRGHLKLIDFGIAKAMSNDTTNIYRDSQVGTINYMAPEAISPMVDCGPSDADSSVGDMDEKRKMKMRLGRPSDIWSLGCILYQMLYGKTPFSALNTIQKLHAIPNPKYEILFPSHLNKETGACCTPSPKDLDDAAAAGNPFFRIDVDGVESVKMCLLRDLTQRASIRGPGGLLQHPFLDLEAARERWSCGRAGEDRLSVLGGIQKSLAEQLGGDVLKDEEAIVCGEIVSTVQRALPAPAAEAHTAGASSLRRSSRSTPLGHRGASPSVASGARTAAATMLTGANRKILPRGLKDQILGSDAGESSQGANSENIENAGPAHRFKLRNVAQSTANKWVRPHLTPEKNDMRSVLDKKFGQLRKFLGSEDEDDNEDSTAWNDGTGTVDEFSFQNL